ncbi:GmrSD restriction endonuclease domain-containing protein [Corynebacterium guangdongense]|uniref:GmrSD restriction endonucleases N-terminal domain-containing protein n=1 Tax=Corynebacterium guangdongense TaxID=1783348 RepID=A0ABU1ZTU2_9CORY|nr:DUF262 domain-containing protein [Corynebacterium guangdongense]MDR7328343.1 hypothetical protein [Corynebacterium guangdongense]WJZ16920.1 hypothetical protein CGUA_01600 [Corynebacterium guangdongense]
MAKTLFRDTSFGLLHLVSSIERGDIALPELQRPFVWKNASVRDLFDSMYKGFPVGNLLMWETGADANARQIGTGDKESRAPRWLVVDGQQRLTSLFSVFTGQEVVREDYSTSRIVLSFRPRDESFEVAGGITRNDPEYLPDITLLWSDDYKKVKREFFRRLQDAKGELSDDEVDAMDDVLDQVRSLQSFPFHVIELDAAIDEEQLAEVFVRINSGGVKLNQADFILTIMSVFWDEGRKELEAFAQACKTPAKGTSSPFNWMIAPQPDQLLRVCIALAFRRAVMRHAYSVLRGKDLATGIVSAEARESQFARLQEAQKHVLDVTFWHEYLRCLERAGFRGEKMITSENAVIFSYVMWLVGRIDYQVPVDELREVIARWFFMAHTTRRYTGSFETQVERDLASLGTVTGADGFIRHLDQIIREQLTSDFWTITMPNELGTSASRSPALSAYLAGLNILDAESLMSTGRVRDRLDPAVTSTKGIERHHLFPKAYLSKKIGISDPKKINQIANMALVEWNVNIDISDSAPSEYWPKVIEAKGHLTEDRIAEQRRLHALPDSWPEIDYKEFLEQRRHLMAAVTREAFEKLASEQ